MEVHRQQCQKCDSYQMRNILVREPGHSTVVYARCAECRELVARYALEDYYHCGKGIESYLRSHGGATSESGRHIMQDFQDAEATAATGFADALEELREEGKEG